MWLYKQNRQKTYLLLSGAALLLLGIGLAVYVGMHIQTDKAPESTNKLSRPARSYSTGRVAITFKNGTSYADTQAVLAKFHLVNTKTDFMELYVAIDIPVSVQSSPVSELNKFYAKVDNLKKSPGVDSLTSPTVYFKPTISEAAATQLISSAGLSITKDSSFQMSYTAEANVPAGTESDIIKLLNREPSVQKASEPVAVPM